jgi:hypothetical protein
MFLLTLRLAETLVPETSEKPPPTPWALFHAVQHSHLANAQHGQKCLAFDCVRNDEGNDTARFPNTHEFDPHMDVNFGQTWVLEQTTHTFGSWSALTFGESHDDFFQVKCARSTPKTWRGF